MPDIDHYLDQLMTLPGVRGASLIDFGSGATIGAAGRAPGGQDGAPDTGAAGMIHATMRTAAFATVGQPVHVEDVVITAGNGYHLLHLLPTEADVQMVLYLWLDRVVGNLAVARRRLGAVAAQLSAN